MANFPHEIKDVDDETREDLLKNFQGFENNWIQIGSKNWLLRSGYKQNACHLYNFRPRPDDVWVVTFARSGTTWTQEMVWLLQNDLNYKTAQLRGRYSFFEYVPTTTSPEETVSKWETLQNSNQRRFLRTHLPFDLLPPNLLDVGCKVVYVARNPKDVAVSYYHFSQALLSFDYKGDFPKFWDNFEKSLVLYAPYWSHVLDAWAKRREKNLHFVFYEDMKQDLKGEIRKVAQFLGKDYSESQLGELEVHLRIENFRNNEAVNGLFMKEAGFTTQDGDPLIRKGVVGGWRDYFDRALNDRANEWIAKNLKGTDLEFPCNFLDL